MAESDWTELTNSLAAASIARGVTHGVARPNGGGNFCYGWNSKDTTQGTHGLFANQVGFAPMPKGGSIRGAIQRGVSGGPLSFSPMFFIGGQGADVADLAYLLGLSDGDPHRIVLRKGKPSEGLPDYAPGSSGILRRSVETFMPGTWLHLRLDMIANPSGDTILIVKRNDLALHTVSAPDWQPVPGMDDFIDDALGINSGSPPYTSGRGGFAFRKTDVTRRAFIDQVELLRQVSP